MIGLNEKPGGVAGRRAGDSQGLQQCLRPRVILHPPNDDPTAWLELCRGIVYGPAAPRREGR